MPKSNFVEPKDGPFAAQLNTFKAAAPGVGPGVGLIPSDIALQAADADYFTWVMACLLQSANYAQQWTAWKDIVRKGGPPGSSTPPPLVLPAMPGTVAPGIEARFRTLAGQVKLDNGYSTAAGQSLDIEGPQQTGPDLNTIQAIITATLQGNAVQIGWGWGGNSAYLDMCELQVDRGAGWVLLAFDTTPNYTDTTPFPATPTKWKYRAIYHVGDHQVGVWSDEKIIIVG